MKRNTWKKLFSIATMAAMLLTLTPACALAAENKTVQNDWITMEFNGYISESAGKTFTGTDAPKGIDLSQYPLENWVIVEFAYKTIPSNQALTLDKMYVVGEGSSLNLYKTNPAQEIGSFLVSVYLLDDNDNMAYTVEYLGIEAIVSETPEKILSFDNVKPTASLRGNQFFEMYPGVFDTEDLLYVVEAYKDGLYECEPDTYGFMVGDVAPAAGYDETKFTHAKGTMLEIPVDGKTIAFEAYTINDNNYVKLRDVALALNGSAKQFNVTWDNEKKAINLLSDTAYTAVGTELPVQKELDRRQAEHEKWLKENPGAGMSMAQSIAGFAPESQNASLNTSKIYLNGTEKAFTAYTIGGNTYFKLRDLGQALDFNVSWNAETQKITLDTSKGYGA